ncbi:MAG: hypothetical protein IJ724_13900 [Muribaculaceae bacterium]|nr:hypothetical protein [Muribaculaceae bacterium]
MKKKLFILIAAVLIGSLAVSMEAKKPKKKVRRVAKEEVWTHISGLYSFGNEKYMIGINYCDGEFEAYFRGPEFDEDESTFEGNVDEKTGLITVVDKQGKVIFTGKMYRGGNQLKGELCGKHITL